MKLKQSVTEYKIRMIVTAFLGPLESVHALALVNTATT
jgi:hypothetical protein